MADNGRLTLSEHATIGTFFAAGLVGYLWALVSTASNFNLEHGIESPEGAMLLSMLSGAVVGSVSIPLLLGRQHQRKGIDVVQGAVLGLITAALSLVFASGLAEGKSGFAAAFGSLTGIFVVLTTLSYTFEYLDHRDTQRAYCSINNHRS